MCEVGGDEGTCTPLKIVVVPSKQKNCPGEMPNVTPVISIAKSRMFFTGIRVACGYGVRRYFPAYLVANNHYDFLHKPNKNNLFSAPITSGVARGSAARGGSRNCRPQMQWCTQDLAKVGGGTTEGLGAKPSRQQIFAVFT